MKKEVEFNTLTGKTLINITGEKGDDIISFKVSKNEVYALEHFQDCCECVYIEDICGDLQDLIGSPILLAEEVDNFEEGPPQPSYDAGCTWTFYKLATIKGTVTIRWYGTSNGYYSERATFHQVK